MGSRQSESHRACENETSRSSGSIATHTVQRQSTTPDTGQSRASQSQDTQQFDVDITSRRQFNELQRLEKAHGETVHDWIDEGMPRAAMGNPASMDAFRKRKGTPVPWNVETQNEHSLQRSTQAAADTESAGETQVPHSVRDVISSSGHSLDGSVQRKMEDRMGESFGDVQVHTGASAASACEDINARAFTVGNHVAFNHGEYDPGSPEGQHVIAHELAHVRQQTGGAVSMLPQEGLELEIDPDPQLEQEAEATANRVMAGGEMGIQRLENTPVHLQRMTPHKRSATEAGLLTPEQLSLEATQNGLDNPEELAGLLNTAYHQMANMDEENQPDEDILDTISKEIAEDERNQYAGNHVLDPVALEFAAKEGLTTPEQPGSQATQNESDHPENDIPELMDSMLNQIYKNISNEYVGNPGDEVLSALERTTVGELEDAERRYATIEAEHIRQQDEFLQGERGPIEKRLTQARERLNNIDQQPMLVGINRTEERNEAERDIRKHEKELNKKSPKRLLERPPEGVQLARRQRREQLERVRQLRQDAVRYESSKNKLFRPVFERNRVKEIQEQLQREFQYDQQQFENRQQRKEEIETRQQERPTRRQELLAEMDQVRATMEAMARDPSHPKVMFDMTTDEIENELEVLEILEQEDRKTLATIEEPPTQEQPPSREQYQQYIQNHQQQIKDYQEHYFDKAHNLKFRDTYGRERIPHILDNSLFSLLEKETLPETLREEVLNSVLSRIAGEDQRLTDLSKRINNLSLPPQATPAQRGDYERKRKELQARERNEDGSVPTTQELHDQPMARKLRDQATAAKTRGGYSELKEYTYDTYRSQQAELGNLDRHYSKLISQEKVGLVHQQMSSSSLAQDRLVDVQTQNLRLDERITEQHAQNSHLLSACTDGINARTELANRSRENRPDVSRLAQLVNALEKLQIDTMRQSEEIDRRRSATLFNPTLETLRADRQNLMNLLIPSINTEHSLLQTQLSADRLSESYGVERQSIIFEAGTQSRLQSINGWQNWIDSQSRNIFENE